MPNWCWVRVTIAGPEREVAAFVARAEGYAPLFAPQPFGIRAEREVQLDSYWRAAARRSVLSFQSIAPVAAAAFGCNYDPVGHDAEQEAWGVKWGASEAQILARTPGQVTYSYRAPWSYGAAAWRCAARCFTGCRFLLSYAEEFPTRGRAVYWKSEAEENRETRADRPPTAGEDMDVWRDLFVNTHAEWVERELSVRALAEGRSPQPAP